MGRHAASTTLLTARTVDNAGERGLHARTPHPAHARALLEIFSSTFPTRRSFLHDAFAVTLETYFRYVRAEMITLRDDAD